MVHLPSGRLVLKARFCGPPEHSGAPYSRALFLIPEEKVNECKGVIRSRAVENPGPARVRFAGYFLALARKASSVAFKVGHGIAPAAWTAPLITSVGVPVIW